MNKPNHEGKFNWIKEMLTEGRTVQITTYGHAIVCKHKHINLFTFDDNGVYIKMGKRNDCINFAKLSAY